MSVEELISLPRSRLIFRMPFFGSLAMYLVEGERQDVPTAATDGRRLYYNAKWISTLTIEERSFVIAHEVMHAALGHCWEWRRGTRNPNLWNQAADYVINCILSESIGSQDCLRRPADCLFDTKFSGMSAEEIYSILEEQASEDSDGECGDGEANGPPEGTMPGSGSQPSTEQGDSASGGGMAGDIMPSSAEDKGEGEGESEDGLTAEEVAAEWGNRLVQAVATAREQGKLPSGLERIIEGMLRPKLSWERVLSQLVAESTRDDYSFSAVDRRFVHAGIFLPDLHSESVSVAIAWDTSGSMGVEELNENLNETWGILKARNVSKIRLLAADAGVHYDEEFGMSDRPPKSVPGGGGTSFVPVIERLNAERDRPKCLIYFTDLCGSFPKKKPPYPVFWVTHSKEKPPFGRVIKLPD